MYVLDTDHWGEFLKGTSSPARRLRDRLAATSAPVAITIVTVEEVMRGWLAAIHRQSDRSAQVASYARLQTLLAQFASWRVLPWDKASAKRLVDLRAQKTRVGTMDLKIASIALCAGATLLTGNTRDFERVPGLDFEDWLSR